jgi:glycosyltransferase involved in cell wall biosynthesis
VTADARKGGGGCTVLIDARPLYISGIGRYLREILSRLLRDTRFTHVTLLGDQAQLRRFLEESCPEAEVDLQEFPSSLYDPRTHAAWLRLVLARRVQADVTYFPHYDTPLLGFPRRSVVTVHDLIHFQVPEAFGALRRLAAGVVLGRAVARATGIITVSEATRRDLVARHPGSARKVHVIPNGVGEVFRSEPVEEVADDPQIRDLRPFLLCVGNRKRHKNLEAAVETLSLLREEMPLLKLVVVGRVFADWEATRQLAAERGVAGAVVEMENVGDDRLRQLYAHCEVLLFPSLYEGFGLPVLEAMACGAPVVASNRSSIPEVAGDAALLVDPRDPGAMAGAVRRLAQDPRLRDDLTLRGRQRATLFSWERAAQSTLDLLYRIGTGG